MVVTKLKQSLEDIKVNKGNLYLSLTVVCSIIIVTFLGGYNIAGVRKDIEHHVEAPHHKGANKYFVPRSEMEQITRRIEENYLNIKQQLDELNRKVDKINSK